MLDTGVLSPNCVFVNRCIIIIIQVDAELLQLKAGSALIKLHAQQSLARCTNPLQSLTTAISLEFHSSLLLFTHTFFLA